MKLTPEQKEAFARANAACSVVYYGCNQYKVRSPWRDIDGPTTETPGKYQYLRAIALRAEYVAWEAMKLLGYEAETISWAIPDYPTGRAIDIYKAALLKAGPVECEVESE